MCAELALGKLGSSYDLIDLNVGNAILINAIADVTEKTIESIKYDYDIFGDLGDVIAQYHRSNSAFLSMNYMYNKLKELSKYCGKGANKQKSIIIKSLLQLCNNCEAKYLVRLISGKMKARVTEVSILEALVIVFKFDHENLQVAKKSVLSAYATCPNFEKIISSLFKFGAIQTQIECNLTPGIPVKLMMPQPLNEIEKLKNRYSLEEMNYLQYSCESYDKENNKILPYHEIASRKRKHEKSKFTCDSQIHICILAFDLLYFNCESLLNAPYRKRRDILKQCFKEVNGEFMFVASKDFKIKDENIDKLINEMLEDATRNGCEGLMIKMLDNDSSYTIAERSQKWLKIEKDYNNKESGSLDLVVIGAYRGTGYRCGVTP
ncbi:DNA ligase-like protein, partial [Leptotrombidium deliense]